LQKVVDPQNMRNYLKKNLVVKVVVIKSIVTIKGNTSVK